MATYWLALGLAYKRSCRLKEARAAYNRVMPHLALLPPGKGRDKSKALLVNNMQALKEWEDQVKQAVKYGDEMVRRSGGRLTFELDMKVADSKALAEETRAQMHDPAVEWWEAALSETREAVRAVRGRGRPMIRRREGRARARRGGGGRSASGGSRGARPLLPVPRVMLGAIRTRLPGRRHPQPRRQGGRSQPPWSSRNVSFAVRPWTRMTRPSPLPRCRAHTCTTAAASSNGSPRAPGRGGGRPVPSAASNAPASSRDAWMEDA
jgi:hypothetical protein